MSITIFSKRQRGTVDFYEIIALCLMIVGVTMLIVIFGSIRSDDRAKSRPFHRKENGRAHVTREEEETTNLGLRQWSPNCGPNGRL